MSWVRLFSFFLVALLPISAIAYTYQWFYGWSPDGSYYAYAWSGTDMSESPEVCQSDPRVRPATWPKGLKRPAKSNCVSLCEPDDPACSYEIEAANTKKVKTWVRLPAPSNLGPHGEIVRVKVEKGHARVAVLRASEQLAETTIQFDRKDEKPTVRQVYWRPDGGAVAVLIGYPDPTEEDEGYPAPRYLAVMSWKPAKASAGATPVGDRSAAESANVHGMKLYRAKDYSHAAEEFRRAVAADSTFVLPHYNLACVAALLGDRDASVSELKWLAASTDPEAKAKLTKGRTDPDLKSLMNDPEVRAIFKER